MKNTFKFLALALCVSCLFGAVSCSDKPVIDQYGNYLKFHEDEKVPNGPKFLPGAKETIELGDSVVLAEYIQYVEGLTKKEYSITVTDLSNNQETNLTRKSYWNPEEPGDYKLTYTINTGDDKGTNEFTITVAVPKLTWKYSVTNETRLIGTDLVFEDYFTQLNIYADAYYGYTVKMDSVTINGEEIDLSEATRFTFNEQYKHLFKFHIETPDGQVLQGREEITVKYVDADYLEELTSRNIYVKGEETLKSDQIVLGKGSFNNGNAAALYRVNGPHILPYIAYEGNYTVGDLVMVDFTGNNMPYISFFRDEYSQNIFDQSKGMMLANGWTINNGNYYSETMCGRITWYGPYMLNHIDADDKDTTRVWNGEDGSHTWPGSMNVLNPTAHYRLICGFTEKNADNSLLTLSFYLLNLDEMTVEANFTSQPYNFKQLGYDLDDDYFTGKIVLYGRYGITTTIDKLYDIVTDKTIDDIVNEIGVSKFKDNTKSLVTVNETLNVSDFITRDANTKFYYVAANDETKTKVYINGDTFSFSENGNYELYFADGQKFMAKQTISVGDYDQTQLAWYSTNNAKLSMVDAINADGSIVLSAGILSSEVPNKSASTNKLPYIAFEGDYGLKRYIVCEFTGNNMPYVSFFRDSYTNNIFDNSKGVLVANGWTKNNGSFFTSVMCGRLTFYGMNMVEKIDDNSNNSTRLFTCAGNNNTYYGTMTQINAETKYRMICGFEKASVTDGKLTYRYALIDITDSANPVIICNETIQTYAVFQLNSGKWNNGVTQFKGSIVLYGRYGLTTTIDKLYAVQYNTSYDTLFNTFKA